ncbi:MAG: sensor domain-containing diguanylate cyclase [Peptostreptococcaceae bacterium]|nr:sensor domain-containing diguanylate cyclase [Peptostreptococcaceae bacterium]
MNKEKYLLMNAQQLRKHLIADIMEDPVNCKDLVDALEASERYQTDYEFRAFVETARVLIFSMHGEFKEVISISTELVERVQILGLWELVSMNWNFLGSAYFQIRVLERAFECFHHVIRNEDEHQMDLMRHIAYNNIALIYFVLKDYEKTFEYFYLALNALEKQDKTHPRYESQRMLNLSYLILALYEMGRSDEAGPLFDRLKQIDEDRVSPEALFIYRNAQMCIFFSQKEYDKAKKLYQETKNLFLDKNKSVQLHFLNDYIKLCRAAELPYSWYEVELTSVERMDAEARTDVYAGLYRILRQYYKEIGNREKMQEATKKYITLLEGNSEELRKKQLDSLSIVNNLIQASEDLDRIESKNTELQLIAEEAIRHKQALQDTYHRIEMINGLGRKITSSLDLAEVVDTIYKDLSENIPLHSFILVVAEPEQHRLRSLAFYIDGELMPEVCIDIDNMNSILVQCYRSKRPIFSEHVDLDQRFNTLDPIRVGAPSGIESKSVIYMPLQVGNETIGAFSIQNQEEGVYTSKHIEFLEEIQPYLSIALNNAVRSWTLEHEIELHQKTQEALKRANEKLSRLSSLDGLTQISNRRDFEHRMMELLRISQEKKLPIAVYMIDIDNFKIYNDTYGHLEGDEVLKKVAQIVRAKLDQVGGLSARFGGEEFIGASIGSDAEQSIALAEEIRREIFDLAIENRLAPSRQISVSIGVAVSYGLDLSQKSILVRWADVSLYQAKHSGKNKVVLKEMTYNGESFEEIERK